MIRVQIAAPAKINLTLHVTGRRDDGYHLLDSLVTFAPAHDVLELVAPAGTHSLTVEGPEAAGVPSDMDNLVMRALAFLAPDDGVAARLEKRLPAASGIGGGSADAAAAWRGMLVLGDDGETIADRIFAVPDQMLETHAKALATLGADVPMCLLSKPCRARGTGTTLDHIALPPVAAVLVNPRIAVSTPEVFAGLEDRKNAPMPDTLPDLQDATDLIGFVASMRNDLEQPAIGICPEIADVLAAIGKSSGCGLARMSGSGATCFGLFANLDDAKAAAKTLGADHPDWWVAGGVLGDQTALALPRRQDRRDTT